MEILLLSYIENNLPVKDNGEYCHRDNLFSYEFERW